MMDLPLIIEPVEPATSSVIILHGLGASKYDFEPVANYLITKLPTTRFILPQAMNRPVTLNAGYVMPAWFDMSSLEDESAVNTGHIDESSNLVISLIDEEITKGIKSENIVIAGFSQGGAVVYHTAFNKYDKPLAGVMALSSYGPTIYDEIKINDTRKKSIGE